MVASVEDNIRVLKSKFQMVNLWAVIVTCSMKDIYFGPMTRKDLELVGMCSGGLPFHLVVFCMDTMRIGMAEVYGCFQCGQHTLRMSYMRCGNKSDKILDFFCENMLYLRNRMRFKPHTVEQFLRKALHCPLVKNILTIEGIRGLKHILHFSGISLYHMMVVARCEEVLGTPYDIEQFEAEQLEYAMSNFRRRGHVDANMWNEGGEMRLLWFVGGENEVNGMQKTGLDRWGKEARIR